MLGINHRVDDLGCHLLLSYQLQNVNFMLREPWVCISWISDSFWTIRWNLSKMAPWGIGPTFYQNGKDIYILDSTSNLLSDPINPLNPISNQLTLPLFLFQMWYFLCFSLKHKPKSNCSNWFPLQVGVYWLEKVKIRMYVARARGATMDHRWDIFDLMEMVALVLNSGG